MKKLIALLLAAIMVLSLAACASSPAADQPANDQTTADTTTEETKTEEKTEDTAASGDVEVVTYYCSIGAYLNTLQAEVANWNETTGKEKGVEIQIISDIKASCDKIEAVTGCCPTLIRCPYGEYDDHVISAIRSMDMEPIQWDVDSLDWKDYGVDSIINTVTKHKHLGNGSIILCHNGAKYTAEALDALISGLKEQGYEIVPISELIYRDNYHMDHEGRQISDK